MNNRLSDFEKVELLFTLYEHDMLRVCLSILKERCDAEDAVSESFIKLIRHRNRITDPKSEKCRRFVMKTAKNTAIDIYRRRIREREYVAELPEKDVVSTADTCDIGDSLTLAEMQILSTLDMKYRTVIECIYIEGLTSGETAAVLKVSEACVRKRLERAKRLIEKSLSEEVY